MSIDPNLAIFIERALAAGMPSESLVGLLTSQGWQQKQVYEALATHYQRVTGVDIPRRTGTGAFAMDAFFYLLLFSTLAIWTIGLASLASALIDRRLADPLFPSYQQTFDSSSIASSMAAILVAFPLFLLISRAVIADTTTDPEKLESPIRRWLTYMALVIAAGVFMGDLIAALTFLLRGELTSRFLAKAFVVLVLSGGVFYYYFGGVRASSTASNDRSRNRLMAALSSAMVALGVLFGFLQLGPPRVQRGLRADNQRVQALGQLGNEVRTYWVMHERQLPTSVDQLSPGINNGLSSSNDPVTHAPFEYHPGQGSSYQLCATFDRKSVDRLETRNKIAWVHPGGHHCFPLDAAAQPSIQMMYPY